MDESKVIYKKRYNIDEKKKKLGNYVLNLCETGEILEYIPIQKRIELKDDYINLAIEFSKTFYVDVDIVDENDYIAVRFYFYALALIDFSKKFFSLLFEMADSVLILSPDTGCNKTVVEFNYITHEIRYN